MLEEVEDYNENIDPSDYKELKSVEACGRTFRKGAGMLRIMITFG
jgi:hypothetical protein